ncbi:MAG: hypothetical protein EHM20_12725 [Alphaproteobacteria bacterium]|nr:MAG: hypothetical protein EHM20_12725 [Alphaproteobacteria bacterium]
MGKQMSDRTKKILGISILVLLVMSMMVAVVSAQPQRGWRDGDRDGWRDGWRDGGRNCRWVCDDWDRQRFCSDWGRGYCRDWDWRWVCKDWDWKCFGRR